MQSGPLVVLGLSSNSGASSSISSPSQDSSSTPKSTSSSPASERSDELAPGNWSRNLASDSKDSNDRLGDLPKWLEEFTDNLDQIRNVLRKWHQGSTVFSLTSLKIEIAISVAKQNNKGSLQKTHWRSSTSSGKVW